VRVCARAVTPRTGQPPGRVAEKTSIGYRGLWCDVAYVATNRRQATERQHAQQDEPEKERPDIERHAWSTRERDQRDRQNRIEKQMERHAKNALRNVPEEPAPDQRSGEVG